MQAICHRGEKPKAQRQILPYLVCFAASLFFFYEFIQGNMFSSIADNLMYDFKIAADKMTYLSSIYYVSNVLFLFVAGYVLDHFSPKRTLLLAMFVCVVSTFIFAHTHSFAMALLCRFMTGIGSAFCFLGPIRVASRWFPVNRMAMITGIIVTFAMSGGILSQYPLSQLVEVIGWRQSVEWVAWFGVFLWGVMLIGIRETEPHHTHQVQHKAPLLPTLKRIYTNSNILRAAWYTSLMNMVVAVFGAMMGILYLIQRLDISKIQASKINAMLFLGSIIGGPLLGWISDKIGRRVLPMKLSALLSLWIMLSIMYAPLNEWMMGLMFFLLGLITAAQVISYALVAESCSPQITAMAVSVISVLTQGGYVIYQNLFSYILTHVERPVYEDGIAQYSLHSFQIAAIILPLGLAVAYFLVSKMQDKTDVVA
ncbi:MAG: MFS transporter [Gammaproteobacteria bacterium]|nr:MFS transporter [Gammaproteobacteria bacterium]